MAYSNIDKPSKYFNTLTYTGDGTNNRSVTGVGFRPEFAWIKRRDSAQGNTNHNLWDFVRGAGNNAELASNTTGAEGASGASEYGYISALNSDGFTLTDGTDATYKNLYTNNSGGTYVSWNWLANGTGVSNTSGSITSTVSANTTSGFSIVTYTGAGGASTVGHGLGVAPRVVIVKSRSNATTWILGHSSLGWNKYMTLNSDIAVETNNYFNDTAPTSSVFSVFNSTNVNGSGYTYVAYCFSEVKGYSKFGSYTGNGSTDGTFAYTGFKPAFVLLKTSSNIENWHIFDDTRNTFNPADKDIRPNTSGAESTSSLSNIDFLSNGFKLRNSDPDYNASGSTYIYMAFSENPFTSSKGIPCTAR